MNCDICGGQLAVLGDLGSLRHFRCINCGMECSNWIAEEEEG